MPWRYVRAQRHRGTEAQRLRCGEEWRLSDGRGVGVYAESKGWVSSKKRGGSANGGRWRQNSFNDLPRMYRVVQLRGNTLDREAGILGCTPQGVCHVRSDIEATAKKHIGVPPDGEQGNREAPEESYPKDVRPLGNYRRGVVVIAKFMWEWCEGVELNREGGADILKTMSFSKGPSESPTWRSAQARRCGILRTRCRSYRSYRSLG